MRSSVFIFFVLLGAHVLAQDSISWVKKFELAIAPEITWTTDTYNNMYIADQDLIKKIDSLGKTMFEQSVKKYGKITTIDARNPMKVMIFAEQQQSIFYLDNTLTKQENDIDLGELFDLSYVTQVSASNQVDKIWTFDQDNSKITLLTQNKSQSIQLDNTAGLIDMKNIRQFFEQNDRLFVVDSLKGVFVFDIYGTLVQFLNETNIDWIDVNQEFIYLLKGKNIEIVNLTSLNKKIVTLPVDGVKQFEVNQNTLFLKSPSILYKYNIEIF